MPDLTELGGWYFFVQLGFLLVSTMTLVFLTLSPASTASVNFYVKWEFLPWVLFGVAFFVLFATGGPGKGVSIMPLGLYDPDTFPLQRFLGYNGAFAVALVGGLILGGFFYWTVVTSHEVWIPVPRLLVGTTGGNQVFQSLSTDTREFFSGRDPTGVAMSNSLPPTFIENPLFVYSLMILIWLPVRYVVGMFIGDELGNYVGLVSWIIGASILFPFIAHAWSYQESEPAYIKAFVFVLFNSVLVGLTGFPIPMDISHFANNWGASYYSIVGMGMVIPYIGMAVMMPMWIGKKPIKSLTLYAQELKKLIGNHMTKPAVKLIYPISILLIAFALLVTPALASSPLDWLFNSKTMQVATPGGKIDLLHPHMGSINCEIGAQQPLIDPSTQKTPKSTGGPSNGVSSSDGSDLKNAVASGTCVGNTCLFTQINPTVSGSYKIVNIATTDEWSYVFNTQGIGGGFGDCTFSGQIVGGQSFTNINSAQLTYGQQWTISNVRCAATVTKTWNVLGVQLGGTCRDPGLSSSPISGYTNCGYTTSNGLCTWNEGVGAYYCYAPQFTVSGTYQVQQLHIHYDSANILLPGTQQCVYQDALEAQAVESQKAAQHEIDTQDKAILTQAANTVSQLALDVSKIIGLRTSDDGLGKAQQLRVGESVPFIEYWDSIPALQGLNVFTYQGQNVVVLPPSNGIYSLSKITDAGGNSYYVPTMQLGTAECQPTGDSFCQLKHGTGWYCDQNTFKCSQTATCKTDLQCNPLGAPICSFDGQDWKISNPRCVAGSCQSSIERVTPGSGTYQCCRNPTDTCPQTTNPPQYCGDDYKCHDQTTPVQPCNQQCCNAGGNVQVKTCAAAGFPDMVCCAGTCLTKEKCSATCNHNQVCESAMGETLASCPDDCLPPPPVNDTCDAKCPKAWWDPIGVSNITCMISCKITTWANDNAAGLTVVALILILFPLAGLKFGTYGAALGLIVGLILAGITLLGSFTFGLIALVIGIIAMVGSWWLV
jgi:hypothetical protein